MNEPLYDIRMYCDADEASVHGLLSRSLGSGPTGERSRTFFRWKHLDNPFGRSFMVVADHAGEIIGLRAFMRWEFCAGDRTYRAVRAVDTATDPRFQRRGIFGRLTLEAIDQVRHETDFIFNTPNPKSLAGYLKMGWTSVGLVPIYVRPIRPLAVLWHALSNSSEPSAWGEEVAAGLAKWTEHPASDDPRLSTTRSRDFLEWRYGRAPDLRYRTIVRDGSIAFFRIRRRGRFIEATLADAVGSSEHSLSALLRALRRGVRADYVAAHFPDRTPQRAVLRRAAFVKAPRGPLLVTRMLSKTIDPDPTKLSSWALTLGDIEVF